MPNWCMNRVDFYSKDKEAIAEIKAIFRKDKPFTTIRPEPDWKNLPDESGKVPANDDRWWDWRIEHWGTKWDISSEDIDGLDDDDPECFYISFDTAWAPPRGIYEALVDQYEDVHITWFYDEPGMQFAGYLPN